MALTKPEAEALYKIPKRVIEQEICRWEASSQGAMTIEIRIQADDGTPLSIRGWYSPKSRRFGLVLLFRGEWVRRWDDHRRHRDPRRVNTINGPHKHRWNPDPPEKGDVYTVNDIDPSDVNRALSDFLKECSVDDAGFRYSALL